MKKFILVAALMFGMTANAGLLDQFIDMEKVGTIILETSDKMNTQLEQLRLDHHAKYDHRKQWEMLCDATFVLKQNLEIVDLLLNKYNFTQSACVPLTKALKLQSSILGRCMDYYDKEVQLNFDNNFAEVMMMIEEAQDVINVCYPFLNNLGL